ncbi:MAG: nucleotide exchange factor GrpE [Ignavibacteriales bacterium]|nr:nucleotide exchange factor GrpE [Ignavibacteriales bacterium]
MAEPSEAGPKLVEPKANGNGGDLASAASEVEQQLAQYKDMLLRKAAEFENYKRRSEQEASNIVKFANESLIEDILPIVDDLERSLKHGKEKPDFDALYKGIELIYQKLLKMLEQRGVKPLETLGTEFSVELHDALMQLPTSDVPPHTVVEEVEKGYKMHERVLRHAKVIVSAEPPSPEGAGD